MASVDSRILTMKFDNRQILTAISTTIKALSKLRDASGLKDGSKGLDDMQNKANRFTMKPVADSAQGVSKAFLAMSTIAITALANITNRAINAGVNIVKGLSLDQVIAGFQEYELNIKSIQTIMANTAQEGTKLRDVNGALDELNEYSDKTIYNFAQMTSNIGRATAAGVKLDDAVSYVKGFANTAALAGANSTEMSGALEQMSQALGSGVIKLQDWMSLERRGIAGALQQEAFFEMAKAAGTLEGVPLEKTFKEWKEEGNTLRGSLEKGWLTTDVFMDTMKLFANELDEAKLKAMGFSDAQIPGLLKLAQSAEDSATKVRTFTQFMDTAKESVASGWSQSFRTILGDFNEATELFTRMSNIFGRIAGQSSKARNDILQGWADDGGREAIINGLFQAFRNLRKVLGAVSEAFRDVFPPITSERLVELSKGFQDLMKRMKPSQETLDNIKRIATGVFSVFSIGVKAVKAVVTFFKDLFGAIFSGSDGFLDLAAGVADFFTNLDKGIPSFELFGGVADKVKSGLEGVGPALRRFGDFLRPVIDSVREFGTNIKERFQEVFNGIDWSAIFQGVSIGAIGGLALAIRKLIKEGIGIELGGGFISGINDALEGLTGVLQGMQANLKANALLKIAGAIALLTVSIVVLSLIDTAALVRATTAIAVSFSLLIGAMASLNKIISFGSIGQMTELSVALIGLAAAMLILSVAIKILSTMEWEELAKGLVGVGAGLAMLVASTKFLAKNSKGMITAGVGLIFVSTALVIMTQAIKQMGQLEWEQIGKGLVGVAGSLLVIIGAMRAMPDMTTKAFGLVILAGALLLISQAVTDFSELQAAGKGLFVMALALGILVTAMKLIPDNVLTTAAGMLVLAAALTLIARVIKTFGDMSIEQLAKGLITLALALAIIGVAVTKMSATIPGAIALVFVAGAINVLALALIALGQLDWGGIIRALIALAGALLIIGAAAAVFGVAAPLLIAGGIALAIFGVGLAAVAVAALLFATAFSVAVAAAGAGGKVIKAAFDAAIEAIPKAIKAFGQGVVEFVKVIGASAKEFVKAFSAVLGAMLDAGIKNVPKIGKLFRKLLDEAIKTIREYFPKLVKLGFDMIIKLLNGISNNIPAIVRKGAEIITKFLNGLANRIEEIVEAGGRVIVKFIRGISNNIDDIIDEGVRAAKRFMEGVADAATDLVDAGGRMILKILQGIRSGIDTYAPQIRTEAIGIAVAIVDGVTGGLASRVGNIVSSITSVARNALNAAKDALGISSPSKEFHEIGQYSAEGLAKGFTAGETVVQKASREVAEVALSSLRTSMRNVSDLAVLDIDASPVITPVLDLSEIQKNAAGIGTALNSARVRPNVSIARASTVSSERAQALQDATSRSETTAAKVEFNQYNTSPKALSSIEIYRNTRAQLSMAKGGFK